MLVPVGLCYGLSTHNIHIDSPLACSPLENLIRRASKVARYLATRGARFHLLPVIGSPWCQAGNLLGSWYSVVCHRIIWSWLPGGALDTTNALSFAGQLCTRRE